ncbi:MAG: potassium transporter TrkG, partial [Clostridia bacterium]|nr:potassium transporter TrkG [Clostridia bacterium]
VGPSRNFGQFTDLSKIVLIFDMLAGRLELFPILLLFSPRLWVDTFKRKTARKIRNN